MGCIAQNPMKSEDVKMHAHHITWWEGVAVGQELSALAVANVVCATDEPHNEPPEPQSCRFTNLLRLISRKSYAERYLCKT